MTIVVGMTGETAGTTAGMIGEMTAKMTGKMNEKMTVGQTTIVATIAVIRMRGKWTDGMTIEEKTIESGMTAARMTARCLTAATMLVVRTTGTDGMMTVGRTTELTHQRLWLQLLSRRIEIGNTMPIAMATGIGSETVIVSVVEKAPAMTRRPTVVTTTGRRHLRYLRRTGVVAITSVLHSRTGALGLVTASGTATEV